MKAQDFMDWTVKTGIRRAGAFARAIDVGRNRAQAFYADAKAGLDVEPGRTVALAMAAVAAGLRPWGDTDNEVKHEEHDEHDF